MPFKPLPRTKLFIDMYVFKDSRKKSKSDTIILQTIGTDKFLIDFIIGLDFIDSRINKRNISIFSMSAVVYQIKMANNSKILWIVFQK